MRFAAVLFALGLLPVFAHAQGTPDQEQLTSANATVSARRIPGHSLAQSFRAGRTGTLTGISMGFYNNLNGSAILRVYEGADPVGIPVAEVTVTIISIELDNPQRTGRVINHNHWNGLSVPVVAGQMYCFELVPQASLADPYGVAAGGGYARGQLMLVDGGRVYEMGMSAVFQTRVAP